MKTICLIALSCLLSVNCLAWNLDMGNLSKMADLGSKGVKATTDIDEPREISLGEELTSKVLGSTPLWQKPDVQHYVNHVGMWLANQSERPDLPWHFGVIDTETVNAFSMPGGNVLITRGLYERLHSESELAGVLGHEISHVVKKHHLHAIEQANKQDFMSSAAKMWADNKGDQHSELMAKLANAGMNVYTHGLDKQDEFEADRMAVVVAARGGYSPYGLVAVLQTLGSVPNDSQLQMLFDTHPRPADRLDQLGLAMGDRLDDLPNKVDDTGYFAKFAADGHGVPRTR